MSATTETTWTCDRCGATTVTPPDSKPGMWITLDVAWLHNGERRGYSESQPRHLCNPCDCLLSAFMRNVPVWSAFTLAASDYFERPKGAAGNAALYDKARMAWLDWMAAEGDIDTSGYDACLAYPAMDDEADQIEHACTRPRGHEGNHAYRAYFDWPAGSSGDGEPT